MRKSLAVIAIAAAFLTGNVMNAEAAKAPVHHLPTCIEEDGSGQLACLSGPQEGVKYVAVVISRHPDSKGRVLRAYLYTDKHGKVTRIEYVREGF